MDSKYKEFLDLGDEIPEPHKIAVLIAIKINKVLSEMNEEFVRHRTAVACTIYILLVASIFAVIYSAVTYNTLMGIASGASLIVSIFLGLWYIYRRWLS